MTVVETDRIDMADENAQHLDELFELVERMIPEGFKVEVVEGAVNMVPQRDTHWEIARRIIHALEDKFGRDIKVKTDVRIDLPGYENGFCPDVMKLQDDAERNAERGGWRHEDVEFVAEVISRGTGMNDYGPKKTAYAEAEIPVYLIADPYLGRCHLFTDPKDGEYRTESRVDFGETIDLTHTLLDLTIDTSRFPRD
ncbi:Uma2 family endonuclease [Streptomyces sp. NPDC059477]|uniref:Uma2 family endonuclease n=1 Tax=Streptomyces sp. NPDC059477 TaxID=3346847 RepID=UPI0036AE03FA